mgnify:CR=1 FL=1
MAVAHDRLLDLKRRIFRHRQPAPYGGADRGAARLPQQQRRLRVLVDKHFLERNLPFGQEQRQIRWFNGEHRIVPIVVFELEEAEIELTVFDLLHLRQSPPSPIDGRPQHRADFAEVEYLLADKKGAGYIYRG